jgi:hypothetical protein
VIFTGNNYFKKVRNIEMWSGKLHVWFAIGGQDILMVVSIESDAVQSGRKVPTFRDSLLSPSSAYNIKP